MHGKRLQAVIALLLVVVFGETIFDWIHYNRLDGQSCIDPLFETVARSDISCVTRCAMKPSCLSSFYTPNTKRCIGCVRVYSVSYLSPLKNEKGSLYFRPYDKHNQPCASQEPRVCDPDQDACMCNNVFVYDPLSASCKAGCTTYGLTYKRIARYFLKGYDAVQWYGQFDVTKCLSYCSCNTTSFTCYSVDYNHHDKVCKFNFKRTAAYRSRLYRIHKFDFYIRDCAF